MRISIGRYRNICRKMYGNICREINDVGMICRVLNVGYSRRECYVGDIFVEEFM